MSKNNKNIESGIPRPYSNKKLPTPKYVLNEFINPLSIGTFLVLITILSSILLFILFNYSNEPINYIVIGVSALIALTGLILSSIKQRNENIKEVPSIKNVSKTIDYVRAASRLTVLTIISGIITTIFIFISHISDLFYFIDDSTRLTIVILITLSYIFSYLTVKTLCSYTSIYKNTSLSFPLKISSIPEFITIVGFVIPPLLVIFTGLIYNGPPIISIPFSLYLIDTISILVAIQLLYISLTSRI